MPELAKQIAGQDLIEWMGLIAGLIYVILATYEKPSCWVFGIISSAAIGWKSFIDYKLIADGFLQIFYIVIGVIGLWHWINGRVGGSEKKIIVSPISRHLMVILISLVISVPLSWILVRYAGARYGFIDTAVTLLSVWATILLVRKDLHNWVYWIILDMILVWLYFASGGYLFAFLFVMYTAVAIWGFRRWNSVYGHPSGTEILS